MKRKLHRAAGICLLGIFLAVLVFFEYLAWTYSISAGLVLSTLYITCSIIGVWLATEDES